MNRRHPKEILVPNDTVALIEHFGGLSAKVDGAVPWREPPKRPETELQAIMEAAPGQPIEEDDLAFQARLEPLRDLLESGDVLDPRELWIIEARYWRRLSFQAIANELSVSQSSAHRICEGALEKLRTVMGAAADEE